MALSIRGTALILPARYMASTTVMPFRGKVTVPEIVVQTASVLPRWSKQACLMSIITPISSKRHIPIPLRDSFDVVRHPFHGGTKKPDPLALICRYISPGGSRLSVTWASVYGRHTSSFTMTCGRV